MTEIVHVKKLSFVTYVNKNTFLLLLTVMDNFTWDNDTSGGNNTEPDEDNFANMYHFAVNGVAQGLVGIAGLIGKLLKINLP